MVSPSPPARVHLVAGKEPFLLAEAVRELRAKHYPAKTPVRGIDDQDFQAAEGLGAFVEWTRTYSFLGGGKFAVLHGIENLEDEDRQRLTAYLQDPPADCTIVLTCLEAKPARSAYVSALGGYAKIRICQPPYPEGLPAWIAERLRRRGRKAAAGAANEVLERIGPDLAALDEAAEQLCVYTEGRTEVTEEDVRALLGRSASGDAYELIDLLLSAPAARVLGAAMGMKRDGVRASEIIARLAGSLERLQRVSVLSDAGWPAARIAETLRINAYFRDKTLAQAARLSGKTGDQVRQFLLRCDEDFKSGRLEEWKAFERFLLEATHLLRTSAPARPAVPARRS